SLSYLRRSRGGEKLLSLTLSLVVMFGIVVALLIRFGGLRLISAIICILFGFMLAATSLAPQIQAFLESLSRTV
ncbi:hypothetical protein, partial [Kribbella solani]|uniref:hypothetical protein n=1 Tax=Kribbella solani TaxID=236067 RepID=UPI0029A6AD95